MSVTTTSLHNLITTIKTETMKLMTIEGIFHKSMYMYAGNIVKCASTCAYNTIDTSKSRY